MSDLKKVSVEFTITEEFKDACELFDIDQTTALQFFLEELSIYFHLVRRQSLRVYSIHSWSTVMRKQNLTIKSVS